MSNSTDAVVAITYVPLSVPPGSVVDRVTVTATGSASGAVPVSQSIAPDAATVTFPALAPDTYAFTAQAFPASGAGYGTPATVTFTITAVTSVTVQVPGTLTVSQP